MSSLNREQGFYWCKGKYDNASWMVYLWINDQWHLMGSGFIAASDDFFETINENRLTPPEQD